MANITFEKDGNSFSVEGPMGEIMRVLIAYLEKNNLRVEPPSNDGSVMNRAIHRDSDEVFGEFSVEA